MRTTVEGQHPDPNKKGRRRRLGGKALTLDAFVNAKSAPVYNPSQIRKQREFYENAKKVKRYKKLVTRLAQQQPEPGSQILHSKEKNEATLGDNRDYEELNCKADAASVKRGRNWIGATWTHRIKKKGSNYLEKLTEEYEMKKQEEERARKEREELAAVKQEARLKSLKARKDTRAKMWKKTRSGQPVMKYRLEHLLGSLQKEQLQKESKDT